MSSRHLPFAAIALLVVIGTAVEVFAASQGDEISGNTAELWTITFGYAVACWVEMDRKARSSPAPFEYSAFMLFIWPLLAPHYLYRTRHWHGFALGVGLYVLFLVPYLAGLAVYYLLGGE